MNGFISYNSSPYKIGKKATTNSDVIGEIIQTFLKLRTIIQQGGQSIELLLCTDLSTCLSFLWDLQTIKRRVKLSKISTFYCVSNQIDT